MGRTVGVLAVHYHCAKMDLHTSFLLAAFQMPLYFLRGIAFPRFAYAAHTPILMRYRAPQYRAMMGFCHLSSQWASWFFATSMSEM